jgi:acyl carrier protein
MDERFLNLVSSTLQVPLNQLKYESTMDSFPEWTSLSHWELIDAIENEYNVEFTMDEATEFQNLGGLFELLQSKCH